MPSQLQAAKKKPDNYPASQSLAVTTAFALLDLTALLFFVAPAADDVVFLAALLAALAKIKPPFEVPHFACVWILVLPWGHKVLHTARAQTPQYAFPSSPQFRRTCRL